MKKVKIMLMAIMVLAVAAGALAFKTKFSEPFCIAPTTIVDQISTCVDDDGNTQICTELITATTAEELPTQNLRCTTTPDLLVGCETECPDLAYTTVE